MLSKHLVDSQLLPALEAMPSFEVTANTLNDIRSSIAQLQVPAPPAPETSVEERFIPGADGTSVRILIYTPKTASRTGCLLWCHGGGMVMASPDGNEAQSRYLAQTAGCVVVAVDFGLAPEHPYPAALEDCYAALRWTHAAAEEFQFPRERIAVAGESGGGCLAAGLSLLARDRGEFSLSAQFLLYPMLDDRTGTTAEPDPMPYAGEFVWTKASNHFAWGAVLGQEPGGSNVDIYAAPGRAQNLADLPPTSIFIGNLDLFIGENFRYARTLIQGGVQTEFHTYPGAYHGFISFAQEADVSKRAFQDFSNSIERHFR
jgi:acetyl esterase/lipase